MRPERASCNLNLIHKKKLGIIKNCHSKNLISSLGLITGQ